MPAPAGPPSPGGHTFIAEVPVSRLLAAFNPTGGPALALDMSEEQLSRAQLVNGAVRLGPGVTYYGELIVPAPGSVPGPGGARVRSFVLEPSGPGAVEGMYSNDRPGHRGVPHGVGDALSIDGSFYSGQWRTGRRHGCGHMAFGQARSSPLPVLGPGDTTADHDARVARAVARQGKLCARSGFFAGEWADDRPAGHGIMSAPWSGVGRSSLYQGQFQRGRRHGLAVHRLHEAPEGVFEAGELADGGPAAAMRAIYLFLGEFRQDMMDGLGVVVRVVPPASGEVDAAPGPGGAQVLVRFVACELGALTRLRGRHFPRVRHAIVTRLLPAVLSAQLSACSAAERSIIGTQGHPSLRGRERMSIIEAGGHAAASHASYVLQSFLDPLAGPAGAAAAAAAASSSSATSGPRSESLAARFLNSIGVDVLVVMNACRAKARQPAPGAGMVAGSFGPAAGARLAELSASGSPAAPGLTASPSKKRGGVLGLFSRSNSGGSSPGLQPSDIQHVGPAGPLTRSASGPSSSGGNSSSNSEEALPASSEHAHAEARMLRELEARLAGAGLAGGSPGDGPAPEPPTKAPAAGGTSAAGSKAGSPGLPEHPVSTPASPPPTPQGSPFPLTNDLGPAAAAAAAAVPEARASPPPAAGASMDMAGAPAVVIYNSGDSDVGTELVDRRASRLSSLSSSRPMAQLTFWCAAIRSPPPPSAALLAAPSPGKCPVLHAWPLAQYIPCGWGVLKTQANALVHAYWEQGVPVSAVLITQTMNAAVYAGRTRGLRRSGHGILCQPLEHTKGGDQHGGGSSPLPTEAFPQGPDRMAMFAVYSGQFTDDAIQGCGEFVLGLGRPIVGRFVQGRAVSNNDPNAAAAEQRQAVQASQRSRVLAATASRAIQRRAIRASMIAEAAAEQRAAREAEQKANEEAARRQAAQPHGFQPQEFQEYLQNKEQFHQFQQLLLQQQQQQQQHFFPQPYWSPGHPTGLPPLPPLPHATQMQHFPALPPALPQALGRPPAVGQPADDMDITIMASRPEPRTPSRRPPSASGGVGAGDADSMNLTQVTNLYRGPGVGSSPGQGLVKPPYASPRLGALGSSGGDASPRLGPMAGLAHEQPAALDQQCPYAQAPWQYDMHGGHPHHRSPRQSHAGAPQHADLPVFPPTPPSAQLSPRLDAHFMPSPGRGSFDLNGTSPGLPADPRYSPHSTSTMDLTEVAYTRRGSADTAGAGPSPAGPVSWSMLRGQHPHPGQRPPAHSPMHLQQQQQQQHHHHHHHYTQQAPPEPYAGGVPASPQRPASSTGASFGYYVNDTSTDAWSPAGSGGAYTTEISPSSSARDGMLGRQYTRRCSDSPSPSPGRGGSFARGPGPAAASPAPLLLDNDSTLIFDDDEDLSPPLGAVSVGLSSLALAEESPRGSARSSMAAAAPCMGGINAALRESFGIDSPTHTPITGGLKRLAGGLAPGAWSEDEDHPDAEDGEDLDKTDLLNTFSAAGPAALLAGGVYAKSTSSSRRTPSRLSMACRNLAAAAGAAEGPDQAPPRGPPPGRGVYQFNHFTGTAGPICAPSRLSDSFATGTTTIATNGSGS
ncbi:hypothetical protein H696_03976 [Fonticula alba]|uniref:Uncharacterized protein n=1 Tax=Fonticula alba TaxID=691883 RepID=A0A058Z5N2_FONAL|nr:hypothetical protein H696_03976 [Fonticula alba]KCV69555.1 hypothetical protein H696_03976 [Fonticula alba]|eukprot:XP_009496120.1 hypothetical protein H696_03976 [Fonticula alba]